MYRFGKLKNLFYTIAFVFFAWQVLASSTILFDGFEDGTDDNWECDYSQGNTSVVTSTPSPYAGTYSFKQPSSGPGNMAYNFGDHPDPGAGCSGGGNLIDDVAVDYYIYYPSGTFASTDTKMWIVNSFRAWGTQCQRAEGSIKPHTWAAYYFTISINSNGEPFGQLVRSDGLIEGGACDNNQGTPDGALWTNYTQNQGSAVALSQDQWEHVKFRIKLNTSGNSDGVFKLWINDVLKIDYSDINFRGQYTDYGWNHLLLSFDESPGTSLAYAGRDNVTITNEGFSAQAFGTLTIKGGAIK